MNEEKIQQIQIMEQSMQQFVGQKQQFQQQSMETGNALSSIEKAKESYKILGNVMVSATKAELKKELTEQKKQLDLRIETLEKQEEKLKSRMKSLQEEIMKDMEDEKK